MIRPPEERRSPLTPQLALRVAVIGSIALALFAIIFFRLWFLQVLSGDQYLKQASVNRVRQIGIPAERGEIVDRAGNVLVDSVPSIAVQLSPPDLPRTRAGRAHLYAHLAGVLGISTRPTRCPIVGVRHTPRIAPIPCAVAQQHALLPYANVTIKTDVSNDVHYYLAERGDQFPGVTVQQVWLRRYPLHTLAAQLFGTVGPINASELHDRRFRGVSRQAIVGQSGLEWYYDRYLRGRDGADRVQVDALGRFEGYLSERKPVAGHSLKLSLNVTLQRAGEQALQDAIANNPPAPAGAFVALNPTNGEVYAMGSLPTFDPNIFTKPLSQSQYQQLNNGSSGYPLFNRAIQSAYPTGSTFKGITSTAALQSGAWSLGDIYDDTGTYNNGPGDQRHNAGGAAYGAVDITQAIMVSSDNFFYNLGARLNSNSAKGGALQQWAHAFGIGRTSGIDLGGENSGILPSPAWRAARNRLEVSCEHKRRVHSCGIADGRPWSVGDNENLAVGQGDLEATPLQLAVAYSTLANGGNVVRPHVGVEVDAPDGTLLQKIDPAPARRLHIDPANLDAIRTGLHEAASQAGGTSADVFAGWPQGQYPVFGKTGTAQHFGQQDQSWYVCFVPDPVHPILVAVTVEQGGFGAQAAAPAAREILSQWFFGKRGQFISGKSRTL
ncbi:MAG: penicillin-binding protein 2 [Solirubrobacterales bacterium]|nr:penicillin-binding protein 2 [Solirubrobacterales bacterium]